MGVQFRNSIALVENIAVSKHFYKDIFGLTVIKEFDTFVLFEDGFSIHDGKIYAEYIDEEFCRQSVCHTAFYFSTVDIFEIQQKLQENSVEFIHEVIEQPWGEKCLRCYDPDFHVIEVGDRVS